ncbi:unnamed protein product [Owenia fusiformis]|uniref:Uncharacterized protein n=1 Tax=Owenia fusiformis TaxID=6347 RepID=A0A8J1U1F1_OWEFU|nr:unnamed protein product [Owenia fusiformis]
MRRKHLEKKMAEEQFLTRVTTYPVVNSALGQLTNAYEATKNSNSLVKSTLEMAETGVKGVAQHTLPIVNKFEPQVSKLNSLGMTSLNKLEESFPVVKSPTEEVINNTKELYETRVKPTVDYVATPVTYSVEKVQNLTSYSTEKINDVKEYSAQKVKEIKDFTNNKVQDSKQLGTDTLNGVKTYTTEKVTNALKTPYGQTVLTGVDTLLGTAEGYVEKYLPDDEPKNEGDETSRMEVVPGKEDVNQLTRAASLTGKVRRRLYNKAMSDLANIQKRSKDTLNRLNFTVDLIQYAQSNLDSAKDKASYYWNEISKVEEEAKVLEAKDKSVEAAEGEDVEIYEVEPKMTMERRGILLARSLAMQLRRGLNMTKDSYKMLPGSVQERLSNAQGFSKAVYSTLTDTKRMREIPTQAMDQVRVELEYIQETVSYLAEVALTSKAAEMVGLKKKARMTENVEEAEDGEGDENDYNSEEDEGHDPEMDDIIEHVPMETTKSAYGKTVEFSGNEEEAVGQESTN